MTSVPGRVPGIFVFIRIDLQMNGFSAIMDNTEYKGGSTMAVVTKDTMIGDLLDTDPALERVFLEYGMYCRECSSARGETIEQACMLHEVDADALVKALNAYGSAG